MSAVLRVVQAGPGVTLQDGGRWGYLRYGVTQAGPMDLLAHEFANRMAGNAPQAAAIDPDRPQRPRRSRRSLVGSLVSRSFCHRKPSL